MRPDVKILQIIPAPSGITVCTRNKNILPQEATPEDEPFFPLMCWALTEIMNDDGTPSHREIVGAFADNDFDGSLQLTSDLGDEGGEYKDLLFIKYRYENN